MKKCSRCGDVKELTFFHKKKSSTDGRKSQCKICRSTETKQRYASDPETQKQRTANNYLLNPEKHKIISKNWCFKNSDRRAFTNKEWKQQNRVQEAKKAKDRYYSDINYKIACVLRSRFHLAVKNDQKTGSAVDNLGCSIEYFKLYIESKWEPGMSWDNWARDGWHIDHKEPLSSFNLENVEQVQIVCHYTNLQPLWAEDNLKKSDKS